MSGISLHSNVGLLPKLCVPLRIVIRAAGDAVALAVEMVVCMVESATVSHVDSTTICVRSLGSWRASKIYTVNDICP